MAETYIEHLARRLAELHAGMAQARRRLEQGGTPAKVEALEELSALEVRRRAVADKMEKAKDAGAEEWSDLHMSFREELDGLARSVENLMLKHS